MRRSILAASVVALATHASAQIASVCPASNDVCFKLNIPQNTASSGSGDIFFQLSAPSSYQWVGLGLGERMAGSSLFVVYKSADGKNVTLSPRRASGYTLPGLNSDAQVTLLEGSGVKDGKMVANVRCSSCRNSNGDDDFTDSDGDWVFAYKASGTLNSDDTAARFDRHDGAQPFSWPYANAKGGNSVNPLVNAVPGAGSRTSNCVPRPAVTTGSATPTATRNDDNDDWDDDDHHRSRWPGWPTASPTAGPWGRRHDKRQDNQINYCDDSDDSLSGIMPIGVSAEVAKRRKMLIAHGTLAALAFVILFPVGAIAIRLASFPGVVWVHAAFQVFAYLVYITAFGLGVYLASEMDLLNKSHPIIGIVLFIALFFMPIFGLLHHAMFKKVGHRTVWSYLHLWLGRIIITLGIINGGLGLMLADSMNMSSKSGIIAYSVVAAVMWLAWVAASIIGERRRKTTQRAGHPPRYAEHSPQSAMPPPENGHYAPGKH